MDSVDRAYENLANAIVVKACEDYSLLLNGRNVAGETETSMRRWFRGRWAGMLCGTLDPTDIMRRVEREGTAKPPRGCKRKVTIHGQAHTLSEWAKITGIDSTTLNCRLHAGWAEEDFLSPPNRGIKRQRGRARDAARA